MVCCTLVLGWEVPLVKGGQKIGRQLGDTGVEKNHGLGCQVLVPCLSLSSEVTAGKLLTSLRPRFLMHEVRIIVLPTSLGYEAIWTREYINA